MIMDPERDLGKDPHRERSTSPFGDITQKVPPKRRDSGSASNNRGRSRSPSPPGRKYPDPIWKTDENHAC